MYEVGTILVLKEQRPPTLMDAGEVEVEIEVDVPILDKDKKPTGKTRKRKEVRIERKTVECPFPYNRVRVMGQSFISYTQQRGSEDTTKQVYSSTDAQGVIVQPHGGPFAATLDEPYGKLRMLYDIEALPAAIEMPIPTFTKREGPSAIVGPTPEEVFAGNALVPAPRTEPNPLQSPLEDPRPPVQSASPLD